MNSALSINENQINKYWAFLLCIFPILDPYLIGVGGLMIVEFLAIIIVLWSAVSNKIVLNRTFSALLVGFLILSLIASLGAVRGNFSYMLQVKVLIFQIINMMAFGFMCYKIDKANFLDMVVTVGVVAASLAIIQFVAVTIGFSNFYDGRLPFKVSDNNYFGGLFDRNTGDLRVHSFFEEPSYLALFELPVFSYCLKSRKIKEALIVGVSCILTGSMLGVLGVVIVMLFTLFADNSIKTKQKATISFFIAVVIVIGIILYGSNSSIKELFDYQIGRLTTIDSEMDRGNSSVSLRLLGNFNYFYEYEPLNKLVGVGFNQYAVYFNLPKNYSNDFVTTLLDFGIIGVVMLVIVLLSLYSKIEKDGKIYFIILVIALAVDHIWFNTYFFYLLTWCMFYMKKKDVLLFSF